MAANLTIRPEDKPKVIMIVVGIVAMNVFVFSRIIGGAKASPAPNDNKQANTPANPATANAGGGGKIAALPGGDIKTWNRDETAPLPLAPDPFRPVPGTVSSVSDMEVGTPKPKPQPIVHSAPPIYTRLPNVRRERGTRTTGILPPMSVTFSGANTAPKEPIPDIEVKGVIMDDKAMVVLRVGSQSTYKNKGDRLQGGVIVENVTQEGVTLRIGNERRTLAPGQSLKASEQPHWQTN
jgi:hypothetical protein